MITSALCASTYHNMPKASPPSVESALRCAACELFCLDSLRESGV